MKNLQVKSYDLMKWTKDTVKNQPDDTTVKKLITNVVAAIHPTHISISVPMNSTDEYPVSGKPAPRTVGDFMQVWTDAIHAAGVNVLFRGTFCEIEGIYDFPRKVGGNRVSQQTYFDKITAIITSRPSLFKAGDIWAPLPERTEGIFQDSTSFLPSDGAGIQANYANFFTQLIDVSIAAFQKAGVVGVKTGMTANNFTEVASGWIPQTLFDRAGIVAVDHYGSDDTDGQIGHGRKPSDMDRDIRFIVGKHGKPAFLQEWANLGYGTLDDTKAMFEVLTKLSDDNVLVGFNYWEPGAGNKGSLLNGDLTVNETGKLLGQYFGATIPTPVPTPVPVPTPTPAPVPETEKIVSAEGVTTIVALTNKGNLWKYASSKWTKLPLPQF